MVVDYPNPPQKMLYHLYTYNVVEDEIHFM
jgi:hypothetical protein